MRQIRDNILTLEGKLLNNSRAAGVLVVFQAGPSLSVDIFRSFTMDQLKRGEAYLTNIPPGPYTVYGYDLEADQLPSNNPAVVFDTNISPIDAFKGSLPMLDF